MAQDLSFHQIEEETKEHKGGNCQRCVTSVATWRETSLVTVSALDIDVNMNMNILWSLGHSTHKNAVRISGENWQLVIMGVASSGSRKWRAFKQLHTTDTQVQHSHTQCTMVHPYILVLTSSKCQMTYIFVAFVGSCSCSSSSSCVWSNKKTEEENKTKWSEFRDTKAKSFKKHPSKTVNASCRYYYYTIVWHPCLCCKSFVVLLFKWMTF